MSIRDAELKRLEHYAKGLGIQVTYVNKASKRDLEAYAEWLIDGSGITIYKYPKQTKTALILTFIHELGHHLHWLQIDKKNNPDLNNALNAESERKKNEVLPKEQRRLIYHDEIDATVFWSYIIKCVDIKIKPYIIEEYKARDLFIYSHYFETGHFPSVKTIKEFTKKYKKEQKNAKK